MKNLSILIVLMLFSSCSLFSQVAINTDGSPPDNSAILDVKSTEKGVVIPRMTFEQRNAILNPVEGLMVVCTNCSAIGAPVLSIYLSGAWQNFSSSCITPSVPGEGTHIPAVTQITWQWNPVPIANGYKWNTVPDFATAMDMGMATSKVETGLTCWTSFTRYVWSYNQCGYSNLLTLAQATSQIPFTVAPSPENHEPGFHQIKWKWTTVAGALGYRWSLTNDFSTAVEMGTYTCTTETGLSCGTAYTRYIWSYDNCGNSPATIMTQETVPCSTCGIPVTDSRDGKVYNTVLIGNQCWFKENLNVGTRINLSQDQTNNQIIEKYCYDDSESNCNIYGGLYQWDEMMQYLTTDGTQGICPTGWHVSTWYEWIEICNYLGGNNPAGGSLKEEGLAHWTSPNTGATNSSGFTALPGGYIGWSWWYYMKTSMEINNQAYFWTSTEEWAPPTTQSKTQVLDYSSGYLNFNWDDKVSALSVRCLKD